MDVQGSKGQVTQGRSMTAIGAAEAGGDVVVLPEASSTPQYNPPPSHSHTPPPPPPHRYHTGLAEAMNSRNVSSINCM